MFVAGAAGIAGWLQPSRAETPPARQSPPAVAETTPWSLRDVDAKTAQVINAAIPLAAAPNPPARPFKMREDDPAFPRALQCLTSAIYYEAANEPEEGQRAVAQVILNRMRHPAYPSSVCAVVYQGATRKTGCQFTFTCDGALLRSPTRNLWGRAAVVAKEALGGSVFKPVGYATHYHANYVVPYWATSLTKNAVETTHIFYRWPGWWGTPGAFAQHYSDAEPDPHLLRLAALHGAEPAILPGEHQITEEALALGVDPRVELISVVDFLAANSEPGEKESSYRKAVRDHFSPYSEHLAVQIYRQLVAGGKIDEAQALQAVLNYSALPVFKTQARPSRQLVRAVGGMTVYDGFITALRDFAEQSKFDTFLHDQSSFYAAIEKNARPSAFALAVEAQSKTARPVDQVKLLLAPLFDTAMIAGCAALPKNSAQPWLLVPAENGVEAAAKEKKLRQLLVTTSESGCGRAV
ncbi:MAG: cell wall hydrolase [Sphingomicrobium sp.]